MSARGESVITLDDREVNLLFTNRALAQAEKAMGKSVLGVVNGLGNGAAGFDDLAQLMAAGMEAARREEKLGGRVVTVRDAFEVMDEAGFADCLTATVEGVAAVISYSRASAEDEAADDEKNG